MQWHYGTFLQLKVTKTRHGVYENKFLNTLADSYAPLKKKESKGNSVPWRCNGTETRQV